MWSVAHAAAADVPVLPIGRGHVGCHQRPRLRVVIHRPAPPLLPAYAELAPYNAIIVQLDEDPSIRIVGNLIADETAAINSIDPTTIQIGEPVRVVFQQVDDVTLPRWVRV